jgi:endonuclease-3
MTHYNGEVPPTMKDLLTLPGVGRKTANVVLGNGFGIPDSGITVDTHVTRLANRMGFTKSKNAVKIEKDLMKITPVEDWVIFTHLFITHGRAVCGRKPKCDSCAVSEWCKSAFQFDHFKE